MKLGIELFSLEGKTAIVTGASKGLGKLFSEALASAGADVTMVSRHLDEVKEAAKEVAEKTGRRTLPLQVDVTKDEQVQEMVRRTISEFGKVDILVNNAGINIRNPIQELKVEDWQQVIDINLTGPWLCCRAVAPHMIQRRYGRVINISSTLGLVGFAGRTPYASSKGGVIMLTKTLALEWAPYGITVNAICPGPFLTPMNEVLSEELREMFRKLVPIGRWGQLHELAGPIIFLASDAASFVTGAVLTVDGGWTAQ